MNNQQNRFEEEAYAKGFKVIAGVDEAGRGPLAGPVVAAACIFPRGLFIEGIDDSKKLSPQKRMQLYEALTKHPEIQLGIGIIDAILIDQINILQATLQAMIAAVGALQTKPDFLLVDGLQLPSLDIPGWPIVEGDSLSHSIAAASIIAKATRDRMMCEYHKRWPLYGFEKHKGYGTKQHLQALAQFGPCPIHRKTFEPIKTAQAYGN